MDNQHALESASARIAELEDEIEKYRYIRTLLVRVTELEKPTDAAQLLKDWGQWEEDLVMSEQTWDLKDGRPHMAAESYERMIVLARRRNAIVAKLGPPAAVGGE